MIVSIGKGSNESSLAFLGIRMGWVKGHPVSQSVANMRPQITFQEMNLSVTS